MIHLMESVRILLSIYLFKAERVGNLFAILDPTIKTFIWITALLGPLSITCLILLLKKIEKADPNKIRWR